MERRPIRDMRDLEEESPESYQSPNTEKLQRVRFILLEAESSPKFAGNQPLQREAPSGELAFLLHNRQFIRRQYRVSAAEMRKRTAISPFNNHGILNTQGSPGMYRSNNFLNILKQKLQSSQVRESALLGRREKRSNTVSTMAESQTFPEVSSKSLKLKDMLTSPATKCQCISSVNCTCGKRAILQSLEGPEINMMEKRLDFFILKCAETVENRVWKSDRKILQKIYNAKKHLPTLLKSLKSKVPIT